VTGVDEDKGNVEVRYETNSDVIPHRYVRDQFEKGKLPVEGTRVMARVVLTAEPAQSDSEMEV
jgi:hypothetical protein